MQRRDPFLFKVDDHEGLPGALQVFGDAPADASKSADDVMVVHVPDPTRYLPLAEELAGQQKLRRPGRQKRHTADAHEGDENSKNASDC